MNTTYLAVPRKTLTPTQDRDWPPRAVGGVRGLYQTPGGAFWIRPFIDGRRTWKKLAATTRRHAQTEAAAIRTDSARSKLGLAEDPFKKEITLAALAAQYLAEGCPNRRLESRPTQFCQGEKLRLDSLLPYFGRLEPDEVRLSTLPKYHAWRVSHLRRSEPGNRTVELELVTLSNVLSYGVASGKIEFNYIRSGRPRFRRVEQIRHCRECAPATAEELHRVAACLFEDPRSEVLGWQLLFAAMTGCRTSELLRLRLNATTPDQAGFIEGNYLFLGRRSKGGVHPYAMIGKEMREMLFAFRNWHQERFPDNPWFFPGRADSESGSVGSSALNHALARVTKALQLPHRTAHGLRSFYVTKRRSDGAPDVQIAAEIGDKTVDLIRQTYGDRPANWTGGKAMRWIPETEVPAWAKWTAQWTAQEKAPVLSSSQVADLVVHPIGVEPITF